MSDRARKITVVCSQESDPLAAGHAYSLIPGIVDPFVGFRNPSKMRQPVAFEKLDRSILGHCIDDQVFNLLFFLRPHAIDTLLQGRSRVSCSCNNREQGALFPAFLIPKTQLSLPCNVHVNPATAAGTSAAIVPLSYILTV